MTENNGKLIGISKVTIKGSIVIPAPTRKKYNINPGDIMIIRDYKGEIKVEKT